MLQLPTRHMLLCGYGYNNMWLLVSCSSSRCRSRWLHCYYSHNHNIIVSQARAAQKHIRRSPAHTPSIDDATFSIVNLNPAIYNNLLSIHSDTILLNCICNAVCTVVTIYYYTHYIEILESSSRRSCKVNASSFN